MRRAILAAALIGAVAFPAASTSADGPKRDAGFTLLQINDTYKIEGLEAGRVGGLGRVRTLRRELEAEGREVLIVHAGDLLFPSVMSKYLDAEPMIATLNLLDGSEGRDERLFVGFGNHEFDKRDFGLLRSRLEQSRFAWLGANLRMRVDGIERGIPAAGRWPNVDALKVVEVGGVKVGLFGITMPGDPRPWVDYGGFAERVEAARESVAALRALGAEWIVAVTHEEMTDDVRLAELVPGIDWICGGHEHVRLERESGGVLITKADADAKSIVRIDVERRDGELVASHRFVDADVSIDQDPEILREVARWLVRLRDRAKEVTGRDLLEVVATTEHALEGIEPSIRGRETALGDFLTDVLRDAAAADVALVNGGAIRVNDDIPAGGDLRVYELEGIFYFSNRPVVIQLTGAELLELLRISVSEASQAHGRFWQVSGLRFSYRAQDVDGVETTAVDAADVAVLDASGEARPLDLERTYRVVTLDYEWENGCRDGYPLFSAGCGGTSPPAVEFLDTPWRELTEAAIARLPNRRITSRIEGRIQRIAVDAAGDIP